VRGRKAILTHRAQRRFIQAVAQPVNQAYVFDLALIVNLELEPNTPEWRVVGPVCESSDDFGAHPLGAKAPDAVVIRDAGAYGFVMASEYNGRALASEVFVKGGRIVSKSPSAGPAAWVKKRLQA